MNIQFTTHSAYFSQPDPNNLLTMTSIFVCLLSDDKNNQLLVRSAGMCQMQTVIFRHMHIPLQLFALFHVNN